MRLICLAAAAALLATPASATDANYVDGVYEGGYICAQGKTFLRLTLDGDYNGVVRGRFFFSSASWNGGSNLTVPDGEFTVVGRLSDSGQLTLDGERWIQQPADYSMVGLSGRLRLDGSVLAFDGNVSGAPSCTIFSVRKKR